MRTKNLKISALNSKTERKNHNEKDTCNHYDPSADIQHVSWEKLERFGLEYREISRFLQGKCTETEMRQELLNKIRQFAKRQDIFFRKIERENFPIHWLDARNDIFSNAVNLVELFLSDRQIPAPEIVLSNITNPKI